jgi:hypothetical protein
MIGSPLSKLLSPVDRGRGKIGESPMNADQQEKYMRLLSEFAEIDIDGDKNLSFKEIHGFLLKKSDQNFDEELCLELFNKMDKDHNSQVSTKEFIMNYIETEEFLKEKVQELKKLIDDCVFQKDDYNKKLLKAKTEEVMQNNGIMVGSILTVKVIEGMNFKLTGINPFIELVCDNQIIETEHKVGVQDLIFEEFFTFRIQNNKVNLEILLKDYKPNGSHRPLGNGSYSLDNLKNQMRRDVIVDLIDSKTGPVGRVHLELQWIHSKVQYFKDIISQLEIDVDKTKIELEEFQTALEKLRKPFGIFAVEPTLITDGKNTENLLKYKIENIAYGIVGRNLKWTWLLKILILGYLILCTLQMFFTPDFLNVNTK